VQGYSGHARRIETYRGVEYGIDFLPKAKIELAVDDSIAEQVMEAVCNVARTGNAGDGKVWMLELEQALRVRTGETGPDAI
jgi:nitrogen regulatory protein PII